MINLINIEKNSIYFFGLEIAKSSYKIIIMSTIILLIIMLSYFIYKFIMCEIKGSFPLLTMGLGIFFVYSDNRLPRPPANITTFMFI